VERKENLDIGAAQRKKKTRNATQSGCRSKVPTWQDVVSSEESRKEVTEVRRPGEPGRGQAALFLPKSGQNCPANALLKNFQNEKERRGGGKVPMLAILQYRFRGEKALTKLIHRKKTLSRD